MIGSLKERRAVGKGERMLSMMTKLIIGWCRPCLSGSFIPAEILIPMTVPCSQTSTVMSSPRPKTIFSSVKRS